MALWLVYLRGKADPFLRIEADSLSINLPDGTVAFLHSSTTGPVAVIPLDYAAVIVKEEAKKK